MADFRVGDGRQCRVHRCDTVGAGGRQKFVSPPLCYQGNKSEVPVHSGLLHHDLR